MKGKLSFKDVTETYEKYTSPGLNISQIYFNGLCSKYFIRSDGSVLTSNTCDEGQLKFRKVCELSSRNKSGKGYLCVHLSVNNKSWTLLVHRLVAMAFIPNPDNKPEVNHIDGDKWNNKVDNLEWNTSSENMAHAHKMGLHIVLRGEEKGKLCKINTKKATRICQLLEENKMSIREIANDVKCTKNIVHNILLREAWTHISKNFNIDNFSVNERNKLTLKDAKKICEKLSSGLYSIRDISNEMGIPYSRVNDIKQRKTWCSVSCNYDFKNYNLFHGRSTTIENKK